MAHLSRLILALFMACAPVFAQAHDGPHNPDMLAVVNSAATQGHKVMLSLTVTSLGGPLVLTGLSAPGARRVALDPVYVNFAEDVVVQAVLDFEATPPHVFALELHFGPVGQGTISVVPELGGR